MHCKKHKRKTSHVVILTSDAVDANVKQFRIKPWVSQLLVGIVCILIGAALGYVLYEEQIWQKAVERNGELQATIKELEEANATLTAEKETLQAQYESEIEGLNEQIVILSETVNQKVQIESELTAQLDGQMLPTEFPLTGSASMEEVTTGDPLCIFTASAGDMVIATAGGTVMAVNEDVEFGHNVWIDHGNGYITIYRNNSETIVKLGDKVVQGTGLFLIGENNTGFGYQMMKDGVYISPMEMLAISG